jgi:glycosyltransferase involved in cell wall biosynthesis
MLVSFVVPVYNAENVLQRCVDSILSQTHQNFEILLVNDGSTDGSLLICNEYASKDKRFRVIDQINSGPSTARNVGIFNANGDYICFIDSDDFITETYLSDFLDNYLNDDTLLIQDIYKFKNGNSTLNCNYKKKVIAINDADALVSNYHLLKYGYPFAKFYKRSVIIDNKILFDSTIHFSEDLLFLLEYLTYCEAIKFLDKANYFYVDAGESLSNKYHSFESEMSCFERYNHLSEKLFNLKSTESRNLKERKNIYAISGHFISRAIETMYRPKTFKNKTERLAILKHLFNDKNSRFYYEWNKMKIKKPLVFLFRLKFIYLFDLYMTILFFIRFKFDSVWMNNRHKIINK